MGSNLDPRVSREPERLSQGKRFHKQMAAEWGDAEGVVTPERRAATGRIDIHIDTGGTIDAVVELKNTDWDRMAPHRLRPNARRYIRQVWRYMEAIMEEGNDVQPSIIFARMPSDPERKLLVERWFSDECVTVVWLDESPD